MKLQVIINYDDETGKAEVSTDVQSVAPPVIYGGLCAAFEAILFRNMMGALSSARIVKPSDDELSAVRNGPRSGT